MHALAVLHQLAVSSRAAVVGLQVVPKHTEQPAQPQRKVSKALRTSEHEAFAGHSLTAAEEKLAKESGMNNIVILNSLTHEQLVELLKVTSLWFCSLHLCTHAV